MSTSSNSIICPNCQTQYRLKPGLAGRSVRCKCGTKFVVPESQPATAHCPSCSSVISADAVICINCGTDIRSAKMHSTELAAPGEGPVTAGHGSVIRALKLVQVGLLLNLLAALLTMVLIVSPFAVIWLAGDWLEWIEYGAYGTSGLQVLGAILCLATPREAGGRTLLIISLLAGLASGAFDGAVDAGMLQLDEDSTVGMLLALGSSILGIVSMVCFLAFFVKLANFLEFAEVTERAQKVLSLYVSLIVALLLAKVPFIGCFIGLLILGLAIYAGVLYVLLVIDLNNAVAYRITEE